MDCNSETIVISNVCNPCNSGWMPVDDHLSTHSINPVQNRVVTNALNNKVDKIPGKILSSNDFTDALLDKLNSIEVGANYRSPIQLIRPNGDNPLFPKLELFSDTSMTTMITAIDTRVEENRKDTYVFNGDRWVELPATGLDDSYTGRFVIVKINTSITSLVFVKCKWVELNGTIVDESSTGYPTVIPANFADLGYIWKTIP